MPQDATGSWLLLLFIIDDISAGSYYPAGRKPHVFSNLVEGVVTCAEAFAMSTNTFLDAPFLDFSLETAVYPPPSPH